LFLNCNITDLGMTPDTESEFYVKEIKDMVNIVQRLLADGKWIVVYVPGLFSYRFSYAVCLNVECNVQ